MNPLSDKPRLGASTRESITSKINTLPRRTIPSKEKSTASRKNIGLQSSKRHATALRTVPTLLAWRIKKSISPPHANATGNNFAENDENPRHKNERALKRKSSGGLFA
jgi:hypothetical protein